MLVHPQDKINAFWEITKKDLDDRKAELRNKDREMEEMEERHQVGAGVGCKGWVQVQGAWGPPPRPICRSPALACLW